MTGPERAPIEVDLDALAEICTRYGIAELLVFGSFARGEAGASSDVDLIYRLRPDAELGWEIIDLQDELVELFGRPVDLLSANAIHPRLEHRVTAEARHLYAA